MKTETYDSPPKIDQLQQQSNMNNLLNKTYQIKMDKANTVLQDHNLVKLSCESLNSNNNLFEALSMAQYLTPNQAEEIKIQFINHLKSLIAQSKVPKKLSIFQTNLSLFKDYNTNPTFTGFQKDECQLLAHFYNNQYEDTLQLLKHGLHFDVILRKQEFENISICKDLLFEIFETKLNIQFESDSQKNAIEQNSIKIIEQQQEKVQQTQQQQQQIESPKSPNKQISSKAFDSKSPTKHKKSMSDNFNLSNTNAQNESNFTLFSNLKVPEDFLQTLSNVQGNKQEPNKDYFSDMFAIQNYNISNSKVTSPGNSTMKYFDYNYGSNQNFPPLISDVVPIHENEGQENDQEYYQKILNDSFSQNIFPLEDEIIQQNQDFNNNQNNNHNNNNISSSSNCHSPTQLNQFDQQIPSILQNNTNFEYSKTPDHFLFNENLFTKKKLAINPNENESLQLQSQQQQQQPCIQSPQAIAQSQFSFLQAPNYFMMQNQIPQQQQQQQQQYNYFQPQQLAQQQSQQYQQSYNSNRKKGPIIVDESKQRYTGKLKFFDETKSYGFIVKDDDNSDVFVHFDDLTKAGISSDVLSAIRTGKNIRFEFCCLGYMGKYNRSRKAIDLVITAIE